jgi:hypothetical protein
MNYLIFFISILFIEVVNPKIDLGLIKEGAKRKVEFKVKNRSDKPIKIYSVSTSCSCTAPSYPSTIPPKSSVDIVIDFDSKGIKGSFERNIVLVMQDSIKYHRLQIVGKVE